MLLALDILLFFPIFYQHMRLQSKLNSTGRAAENFFCVESLSIIMTHVFCVESLTRFSSILKRVFLWNYRLLVFGRDLIGEYFLDEKYFDIFFSVPLIGAEAQQAEIAKKCNLWRIFSVSKLNMNVFYEYFSAEFFSFVPCIKNAKKCNLRFFSQGSILCF